MSKLEIAKICDRCDSWMIPTRVDKDGQHWYCPLCGNKDTNTKKVVVTDTTSESTKKEV